MTSPIPAARFLDRSTPPHLITLILMASLASLTINVFLPALPAMAKYYGTNYGTVQLTVTIYLFLSGGLQLILGPIADRFGRRPVVLAPCAGFILATIGVLLSPTVEVMLFFRMLQAVIATCMVLSRAIVRDMVPANQAASMIGWVTMGMAVVPMFAPTIGGLMEQAFGWQSIFGLMLLLGIGIYALCWADLGETSVPRHSSLTAQMRAYPALLRAPTFWGYAFAAAASSGAYFSFLGGAPAIGVELYRLSPSELGMLMALPGFGYVSGNFLSGKLASRLGISTMMLIGATTSILGMTVMLLLALSGVSSPVGFFPPMILCGLANGMLLPSANVGLMSVRSDLIGSASGLGGALQVTGGAVLSGVAALVVGDGSSAMPLILLMMTTSVAAFAVALWLKRAAAR